jgi:hypothetical protein
VLHFGLFDSDRDCRLTTPDLANPIGVPEDSQAARDGFVEAFGVDLDGMLNILDVATAHSAYPKRHASLIAHSLFVRYAAFRMKPEVRLERELRLIFPPPRRSVWVATSITGPNVSTSLTLTV